MTTSIEPPAIVDPAVSPTSILKGTDPTSTLVDLKDADDDDAEMLDIPDQEDVEIDENPANDGDHVEVNTNKNDHDNENANTNTNTNSNSNVNSNANANANANGSVSVTDVMGSFNTGGKSDTINGADLNGSAAPLSIAPGSLTGAPSANVAVAVANGSVSTPTPVATGGANTPTKQATTPAAGNKRIDVDDIMTKFQKSLGPNWERYRTSITHFLIGKLTRLELQDELDQILDPGMIYMHNHFLLANMTNALRDAPQGEGGMLTGWSTKHRDHSRNVKGDSQLAKLKEDIMGLSLRERRRIKAISKDSGKRAPIPSTITATRQAMLPKIPFVNDRDKLQAMQQNQPGADTPSTPATPVATKTKGSPAVWTQNIIHSYEAPLASETYELPDNDSLMTRMLGVSLEHGLLQGVSSQSADVMMSGLEFYLKDIIQQMFDHVKHRKNDHGKMTIGDAAMVLETSPHGFVELSGPLYRLKDVMLNDDDDELPAEKTSGSSTTTHKNIEPVPGKAISDSAAVKSLIRELLTSSS